VRPQVRKELGKTQADRGWQITYKRKKDLRGDVVLKFPALKSGIMTTNVEYKHYQDADLVALDAKQALAGVTLRNGASSAARNIGLAAGAIVLAAIAFVFFRKRPQHTKIVGGLAVPDQITPFSVVAFLRRIQREHAARLDEGSRTALGTQIREIESAFFSGATPAGHGPDLEAVTRKWMQAVG